MRDILLAAAVLALCAASQVFAQDPAPPESPEPASPEQPDPAPATGKADPAPASPADTSPRTGLLEELLGFPVRGRFALRLRARWLVSDDDGSKDLDLYEDFSLDVGDPKKHFITGSLSLHVSQDLDGEHAEDDYFVFDSITDTYDNTWHGILSHAYVDLNRLGPIRKIRVGRQSLRETPVLTYFDGAGIESVEWKEALSLQAGLYGGVPVHTWESSWEKDYVVGAWVQARPFTGNRVRVDYTRFRDVYRDEHNADDLLAFSAWQRLFEVLTLSGHYSLLDNRSRDLRFRADFYHPEWDTRVDLSFYRLCRRQVEQSIDTELFRVALGEYFPYNQLRLLAAQGIGPVVLQAGAEVREVDSYEDERPGNRSWQRYFVTPGLNDWPMKGFSASLTVEYWNVKHTQDGDTWSAGCDVSWKPVRQFSVAAGTSYALYKFDVLENTERERVRTVFARVSVSPVKPLRFDLSYEFEYFRPFDQDSDRHYFHTVKALGSLTF